MRSTPTTSRSSARSTGGASNHAGRAPKASWNPSLARRSSTVMRTAGDTGGLLGRSMPSSLPQPHGNPGGAGVCMSGARQTSATASATIEVEVLFPMTRRLTCRRLALVVAVAAVLAGCRAGGADGPAPPTLVPARPRFVRVVDGYDVFAVNAQQYELVGKRIFQVLRREGLWDQGVRLGV